MIKDIEYVRSKGCALVEFVDVESAKKAMLASLVGDPRGGGGIFIDSHQLYVLMKRDRGDRPTSRYPRGGTPNQSYDRGGFRGTGRPRGRGFTGGKPM